ncbi:MAG: hypothetical protein HYU66_01400, partial [Armatimonadetes bacterium]|nr:hypothetical protein [Armatimonadota bacterium]
LKYRHLSGVIPPAETLAELLQNDDLVLAGSSGAAPEAALEFWLGYAAAPVEPDLAGGQEDLLAGLTWYFAARAKGAKEWGTRGDYPLVVSNDLQKRLLADRGRFEVQVPNREAREARMTEVVRLEAQVRDLVVRLGKGSGAP